MKKDKHKTPVIFRMFKDGDIIAIFPAQAGTNDVNTCGSYMHIGQHSACSVDIASIARIAHVSEYRYLRKELEGLGYNLHIIKRMCSHHRNGRLKQINREV